MLDHLREKLKSKGAYAPFSNWNFGRTLLTGWSHSNKGDCRGTAITIIKSTAREGSCGALRSGMV